MFYNNNNNNYNNNNNNNNNKAPRGLPPCRVGGTLHVSTILRATLVGGNAPGSVTQARQVKGERLDKE